MSLKKELHNERKNPFHFYIITGNLEKNKEDVFSFLENDLNFPLRGNSDFHQFSGLDLPIADVRKIKSLNSQTKNSKKKFRVFFISVKKIDREAQNAFLKTLEEPTDGTIFFLLIPKTDFLLDTILSRGRVIIGNENNGSERAEKFLQSSYLEREKIIKKISNFSKESAEVKDEYINFLVEIEIEILKNKEKFLKKMPETGFGEMYKKFLDLKNQAS